TEWLALGDVAEVHLDGREGHRLQAVVERDRGMRQRARIDDASRVLVDAGLELVEDGALVVRLEDLDVDAELGGRRLDGAVDVGEGGRAVDRRLAPPEEVEVRSVEDQ